MKINNNIFGLMGAIGLLFAGCSTDEDLTATFHDDANAVHITAEVGKTSVDGFTRSNPLGNEEEQAKFNEGDEISIKADDQEAVTYKLTSNGWEPQGSKYLKWQSDEMNFTAYYPASFNGTPTQPTEYNSVESLAAADFMSYTGKQSKPLDNTLNLSMKREMARVVIDIASFNDQYDDNTSINSVTINGNVKAYKHDDDNKFYALMVPCQAQTDQQFLSLEVGENNTVETVKGIPALEAGKSYTYHLTVGKNKVEVNGITVEDWTTGATIADAEATWYPYVTFTAAATQTFKMTTTGNYTISNLEYSLDGNNWTDVEKDKEVEFGGEKGSLFLRGTNTNGTATDYSNYSTITFTDNTVKVACTGDIRTLLNWDKYKTVETSNARFIKLFYYCTTLTSAPELPATTLANYCYNGMFRNCWSLTTAPALPASTLANYCYDDMFDSCENLTTAPALLATTLAENCYHWMFTSCSKLASITMLAPNSEIRTKSSCVSGWLDQAGVDATSTTLKVKNKDAYNALVDNQLHDKWKIGTCTVLDENGNTITEDSNN